MSVLESDFYLPYNPELKDRAKELRKNMTPAEMRLWNLVLKHSEYIFNRQKIIDNFIVDFYCAKLRLVIELDGNSHFSDQGVSYDEERTQVLESFGLKVIRFNNKEVINNLEFVKEAIFDIC